MPEPTRDSAELERRLRQAEKEVAVLEQRVSNYQENLALQAKEYERRLTDLNHAHDKQVEDQQTYIPREKYEGFEKEVRIWMSGTRDTLASLQGRSTGMGSAWMRFFQWVPLIVSIAALAAMFWQGKL